MKKFIINSAFDMHLHLRDDDMLKLVAPLTSNITTPNKYINKLSLF